MRSPTVETGPQSAAPSSPVWDKGADGWNKHATLIRSWLHDVTAAMLDAAGVAPGSRVLDIAAGAGDQTLDVARRVGPQGYVLATDISARMLALAQENLRAAGLQHVETRLADAQALGLAGSDFDAAVCRLGLMFCANPLDALSGTRQALKPGGRLAAVVFSQPQHNPCLAIMMATALQHAGVPAKQPFEPGTLLSLGKPGLLAQLLDDAGFVNIEVQSVSAPFRVPSSQHYVDFVRASGSPVMAILASLPLQAQKDAWDDMVQRLNVFTTPAGWVGPNELLLCAAVAPAVGSV
ncbi:MAG: class I SAM-dependent methyltransferase [Rhodoferax sp.]|uniref:class I SAM-dependent methyltransferase n=1 Tax=Rhodoferax sp. TaxID=50421 RepID=UPI00271B411A|nr:class I SAM-dependent methyltransferase [Rhodoferax sp.]MDO8448825.1 class I SAM-dependent methyltransferase [Rhodoferax sp.]